MTDAELADGLEDTAWRLNHLYTIVDEGGNEVPFRQREVQRDAFETAHGCDVYLKSRQHGITTEKCIEILDDCLWTPHLQCGIIAHTKLDAQNIFSTKIKTPYERLPEYVKMLCPVVKWGEERIEFANGSSIRVAVSFRSATTHRLHISEYGKICAKYPQRAQEIKTGTLPSVHPQMGGRVTIESTAEGAAGHFYELCTLSQAATARADKDGRALGVKDYRFHFYAWWQDPKNRVDPEYVEIAPDLIRYFDEVEHRIGRRLDPEQRAWYAVTRDGPAGLGRDMKREHPSTPEEAFEQSVEGAVYGQELEDARREGRIGSVPYIEDRPVYTAWDLGYGDATCVWFFQTIRDEIHLIDFYSQVGRGAAYHARQVLDKPYVYDMGSEWCLMPHDVMKHDQGSGQVLKDIYEAMKLRVQVTERPQSKADGIAAVRSIFNRLHFDQRRCSSAVSAESGLGALAFYRFEWDETLQAYKREPVHDWASHPADALQTLALGYKYGLVGGEYVGDSSRIAACHAGSRVSPYSKWPRFNRGRT